MTEDAIRWRDVRDGVLLADAPDSSEERANRAFVQLGETLRSGRIRGLLDAIPGACSLLVVFDPARVSRERLGREVESARMDDPGPDPARRLLRVPVAYGGPDLPELAHGAGLAPEEFARRHAEADYRVAFIGFAPGFPYLVGLPAELHAARLLSPRARVPPGSVAIGGRYTGIYPAASPGGWRLIGQTTVRLFDPAADPPELLRAGDRVVFDAVSFQDLPRVGIPDPPEATFRGRAILRVITPGSFTTIQGAPVHGFGSSGVPAGGAMDRDSLSRGNALVGNAAEAPGLEMALVGPELEVLEESVVALAGADFEAECNGSAVPREGAWRMAAGDRLRLGRARRGARAYLAVRGGIETSAMGRPPSPARRLAAGDTVAVGSRRSAVSGTPAPAAALPHEIRLRVILGPEADFFAPAEIGRFFAGPWRVSSESDRRGLRLEGQPPLSHASAREIAPSGMVSGSIQVPGSGLPIVLGPDGPVTGGYPRIATVIGADLSLLGQAAPGAVVRLTPVSLEQAMEARRASGSTMRLP